MLFSVGIYEDEDLTLHLRAGSMLTDVDGDALDVFVAADPAHAIARRVGGTAWWFFGDR